MSIDYLSCEHCGESFPDCNSYVSYSNCGITWCSDECADADGYEESHCKLYVETDEGYVNENSDGFEDCIHKNDLIDGEFECCNCENWMEESCKYCRHEDYDDHTLLIKAMELLKCDRQYLIDQVNNK